MNIVYVLTTNSGMLVENYFYESRGIAEQRVKELKRISEESNYTKYAYTINVEEIYRNR